MCKKPRVRCTNRKISIGHGATGRLAEGDSHEIRKFKEHPLRCLVTAIAAGGTGLLWSEHDACSVSSDLATDLPPQQRAEGRSPRYFSPGIL